MPTIDLAEVLEIPPRESWTAMKSNRADTYRGIYIPAWLMAIGLSPEAMLIWGVMAKLTGRRRRLSGYPVSYLGSVVGLSTAKARRAVKELIEAEVIQEFHSPGKPSTFAFRGPQADSVGWNCYLDALEAEDQQHWRSW